METDAPGPAGVRLLTKAQVREQLNVSRATLDRLISAGKIPAIKLAGTQAVRIAQSAVDEYIARSAA